MCYERNLYIVVFGSFCDERSESRKGLGLGMRITAVFMEKAYLVQKYKRLQFLSLVIALPARRFAPHLSSPTLSFTQPPLASQLGTSQPSTQ